MRARSYAVARPLRRRLLIVLAVLAVVLLGGGMAVATDTPDLHSAGPTTVTGSEASAVFGVGDRTIRQVRYQDGGTLRVGFRLVNDGRLPVTVTGLDAGATDPRLFDLRRLVDETGAERFTVDGHSARDVVLELGMSGCETLSARAGSFVSEVSVRTSSVMGWHEETVPVTLPEELRAGSPREAGCANATANSRPPG